MDKRDEVLLKIVGCLTFLINNSAYLQQQVLARIENPPMDKYEFIGIFKYNKKTEDEIEKLIKDLVGLPVTMSVDGKDISDRVGKMTKEEAKAAGIDYKLHPYMLDPEEAKDIDF